MLKQMSLITCSLFLMLGNTTVAQMTELAGQSKVESQEEAQQDIEKYSRLLEKNPADIELLVRRGNLYFMLREFDLAVEDYDRALAFDEQFDAAYFGRGMALGRAGFIKRGIKDLSVYIKRHPTSSLAYTKRGIRHLWLGEETRAMQDFIKAIKLDPKNAEAHDDVGVIYAKRKQYSEAIKHFSETIRLDPSYQKGYHNLAMSYYLVSQDVLALSTVDKALSLNPQARDTLILKAEILTVLGKLQEAQALRDEADFLPEGNWSESIPIQ